MSNEIDVYIKTATFIGAIYFTVKAYESVSYLSIYAYGGMALLLTLSLFTALRDEK